MKLIVLLLSLLITGFAHANINIFTDHQIVTMFKHGVHSERFPTGRNPYLGRIGLEYQRGNVSYTLSYIHRSNADINGRDEYNYDGIAFGIKLSHCIWTCAQTSK